MINSILDKVGFTKQYEKEFGSAKSLVTYRIWERVSTRYVSALKGKVTAYVDAKALDTAILDSNEHILAPLEGGKPGTRILVAELQRIADIMEQNGSIRSVELIDVRTGAVVNRMDRMTLFKEARRMGGASRRDSH